MLKALIRTNFIKTKFCRKITQNLINYLDTNSRQHLTSFFCVSFMLNFFSVRSFCDYLNG